MASSASTKKTKSPPPVHLCGVPHERCKGSRITTNAGMKDKGFRLGHGTPEAAFRCMVNHLVTSGWTRIGSREFAPPGDGPVRVLTKPTRYGATLRSGKGGVRHQPSGRAAAGIISSQ
mgnify:CR=1 FL=1